eukprot:TRINITY_DN4302_c0_g1_i2.p1 TRINITY_DN4302_c0_g1~~TRINITY_DN4302_c0_g1_i2.p1  ORF type:complete len:140 (+),score=44.42 TRINITY_DN4302_c0_g1_i2:422-841(+)
MPGLPLRGALCSVSLSDGRASAGLPPVACTTRSLCRYSLRRLTPGHPIPIRVVATLKDSTGGSKCETNDFYTPLQSDAVDEESFEVLRFSELDKEYQKTLDPEKITELHVSLAVYPNLIPRLVDEMFNAAQTPGREGQN